MSLVEKVRKAKEEFERVIKEIEGFKEIRDDVVWAGKALRRARKHFWKGYIALISGSILTGLERIVPKPYGTVFGVAGVICLAISAFVYWSIMRG